MLGDLLAAALNPNVGAWFLSPMASEIEAQTVRWIAELIGYPTDCGGLLVSGGNMANFVCCLAARQAKAGWDVRATGMTGGEARRLRVYVSKETHNLQPVTQDLSIATFRYVPSDLRANSGAERVERYLNELNRELLARLQNGGEAYVSNAVVGGKFVLRACLVNFRTSLADVEALPEIVARIGREADVVLRPNSRPSGIS